MDVMPCDSVPEVSKMERRTKPFPGHATFQQVSGLQRHISMTDDLAQFTHRIICIATVVCLPYDGQGKCDKS